MLELTIPMVISFANLIINTGLGTGIKLVESIHVL